MPKSSPKSLESRVSRAKALDGGKPDVIGIMEAAARLRVGRSTMQKLVREGAVDSFRLGNARRITVASIEALVKKMVKNEKRA